MITLPTWNDEHDEGSEAVPEAHSEIEGSEAVPEAHSEIEDWQISDAELAELLEIGSNG